MPSPDSRYTINERDVIAESVGGETLIINLNSGVYYSADAVGDDIWRLVSEGRSVDEVIEVIGACYTGDATVIREAVLSFVTELRGEDLIVEASEPAPPSPEVGAPDAPPPFVAPVLQRYTDFQDLLLLDPIHEVHEPSGWPVAKPESGPPRA